MYPVSKFFHHGNAICKKVFQNTAKIALSGVFSTGAMGALAPAILGQSISHRPLASAMLGQSITVSTRNSKVQNTPSEGIDNVDI